MATLKQVLLKLVDKFIPEIRDAFIASIRDVSDRASLSEITNAIRDGDLEKAFRRTGMSEAALRPLTTTIERAFETTGVTIMDTYPKTARNLDGRVVFRFDVRNSRAERWLREQSSSLVSTITDDARRAVQNTITDGVRAGTNPRNIALDIVGRIDTATGQRIGGVIGLAPNQERWAARTRVMLEKLDPQYFKRALRDKRFDKTVAAAIKNGTPLSAETINKLMVRYRDNVLRYRGETIGRTEANQSLNRADYEATQQAIDSGAVKQSDVTKIWDATGDKRTREDHLLMDGQTVGFDAPFTFPDGTQAMFPGDISLDASAQEIINCRCRFRTRIDWARGAVDKYKGKINFDE